MRKLGLMGLCLWILGGLSVDARAEETVTLQEVVVTASRDAEKTVKVPAHVTVVTAKQIETSNYQNVPEVLRALAGVHITDVSGNQRNYNVDLRGFGESSQQNILLLVDGRRVNLPDLSGPDWNLIPLERIERIEVLRGGRGNVLYGDNATAGVINIITKEGRAAMEATATAKYGSYETVKANASVSAAHDTVAYDITAGYSNSDGYRDNSESDAKDIGANLKLDPSDSLRLHLSGGYHYDDTRNPGALLQSVLDAGAEPTDTLYPDDFSKFEDYYVKAGLDKDMLSNDMFKLETSYRNRESTFFGTYSGGWFDADTTTDIWTVSPQLIFRGDFDGISNHVTMGLDVVQAEQDVDNTSFSELFGISTRGGTLEKDNIAYYIHDRLGVGDKLFLSGGYRNDRVKYKYDYEDEKSKKIIDEEAANVGINYAFGPNSKLYGSFTQGFRYPVIDEQFSFILNIVDPTLQPQRSRNYEIGGSVQMLTGFVIRLNLFRTETKDEIFYNAAAFANQNMEGKTIRQGAEIGFDWRWKALKIGAGYTYTDTEFDGGVYNGKEVPAVPRDRATARIGYTIVGGLFVGADAVYVGERFLISDFENDFDKAEDYTVVNAKIQYDWRRLSFFVDLNNLFDEEYSTYSGLQYNASTFTYEPGFYPAPEFNVLAGVRGRFGK